MTVTVTLPLISFFFFFEVLYLVSLGMKKIYIKVVLFSVPKKKKVILFLLVIIKVILFCLLSFDIKSLLSSLLMCTSAVWDTARWIRH